MTSGNNARIAKNTAFLYVRMLLTMLITLYTSRVVLERLGVDDFGIYSVVGGIVSMFTIISASLTSAISRFLTYELGKKRNENLTRVFSTSVIIQIFLSIIVIVLIETIGVWFLNNEMNIAKERIIAANYVLQCSVVTFVINMLSVPYNAAIIAHERMKVFAYISFLEVTLKLGVAFLLFLTFFDSLIMYAILIAVTSLIVRIAYGIYCKVNFVECKVKYEVDKSLLKEMLSYSGWNFIGSSSAILRDQGVNVIMNLFCGTAVNAARAIAIQINHAVSSFSSNFMLAVNPQIIKSYASGEIDYMLNLAFRSSRFSYCLLFCLSLPLLMEMPFVINMWLTTIPPDTVVFARLILLFGMSESLSLPLQYVNQATGKIRNYQLTVGLIQLMNFPVAYLLLWLGLKPEWVFIQSIVISQICLCARLVILRNSVGLSIRIFLNSVYKRIIGVTIVGCIFPLILKCFMNGDHTYVIVSSGFISFISAAIATLYIGCNYDERNFIIKKFKTLIIRK